MRVLVRVEVRDGNAGTLNSADLGGSFDRDFFRVKASEDGTGGETLQAIAEMGVPVGQSSNVIQRSERHAINENNVTSDAQIRNRRNQLGSLCEGGTIRHQRRRGNDTTRMSLDDGAIDTRSESEIVRIDNETAHAASLAGRQQAKHNGSASRKGG